MKSAENPFVLSPAPLNVAILVFDDCNTLSFAAAVDPLRAANRRAGKQLFHWQFLTPLGASVSLTSGLSVAGTAIADLDHCDLLVVVAGFRLQEHASPRLLSSLRRIASRGTPIAAIDGGPWLLASAGLLDGHKATTHWEDLEEFATRFPNIDTQRDRFCISGPFATSGGAAPCIDMMLHLIALRHGQDLSRRVGSAFLYDPVPQGTQSPSSAPRPVRRNPQIARALELMETNLQSPLPLPRIAALSGLSPRGLQQRFETHMGHSPKSHYLALRLSEAYRLITDTSQSVREISVATGFSSPAAFARAFRAQYQTSARDLRSSIKGGSEATTT